MLGFLFKPKWKHRDPAKRMRGVQNLQASSAEQHAILLDMALHDIDPRVRLKAVEKICDLNCLAHIIADEPDEIVSSMAQNRYYSLIAGTAADSSPDIIAGRYKIVDDSDDEGLKKFVIHHSPDEKLQFTALQSLLEVDDIARVAISAPNIKIREAAARMAEQMANKVASSGAPPVANPPVDTTSANESIDPATAQDAAAQRAEETKATLRAEMNVRAKPPAEDDNARFRASGETLQMDDDSSDALQALLDQKLAQRKKA